MAKNASQNISWERIVGCYKGGRSFYEFLQFWHPACQKCQRARNWVTFFLAKCDRMQHMHWSENFSRRRFVHSKTYQICHQQGPQMSSQMILTIPKIKRNRKSECLPPFSCCWLRNQFKFSDTKAAIRFLEGISSNLIKSSESSIQMNEIIRLASVSQLWRTFA